ncbi:MAG: hypothetical protein LBJ67_00330 [Planctomycetaceae bacterium]|nr:hypothetical protein [Planctomycetaceae bacterium]
MIKFIESSVFRSFPICRKGRYPRKFRSVPIDAWREAKYQQSRNRESEFRRAIVEGQKRYDSN